MLTGTLAPANNVAVLGVGQVTLSPTWNTSSVFRFAIVVSGIYQEFPPDKETVPFDNSPGTGQVHKKVTTMYGCLDAAYKNL